MSKGHAAMALYAVAIEFGLLDKSVIETYLQNGSSLWGHPSMNADHEFIQWSTGSLGHALPVAVGKAYARENLKLADLDSSKIAVVLSDGELDEGSNWEALLFAGHHRLRNLQVFIDYNKWQSFGRCEDVMSLEPLVTKFESFGWSVFEVDGHDSAQLRRLIAAESKVNQKPLCFIAHTIKAKGWGAMEDRLESHYRSVDQKLFDAYFALPGRV
jgi:transketolase